MYLIASLSSIWDPNSMASPVYWADEQTPQNHRTRTGSHRLMVSQWDHHSGDGQLGRSPSSISEELKRNKVDGVYGSIKAHQAAQARKRHSHQKYLLPPCPALRDFVLEKLQLGWSPQQISGRLKREITEGVPPQREYINHESIYQFLYDPAEQEEKLWAYLPRRHRQRRR